MIRPPLAMSLFMFAASTVSAQVDAGPLSYVVVNHGKQAGSMQIDDMRDSIVVRYRYVDRNRGPNVVTTYLPSPDGSIREMRSRGLGTDFFQREVSEEFTSTNTEARWKSSTDSGRARARQRTFYRAITPTPYDDAAIARFLLHQPAKTSGIYPDGKAAAEVLLDTTLTIGTRAEHVRLVAVKGLYVWPNNVWLDDHDALFSSSANWFTTVRSGWESVLPALRASEYARVAHESAALAKRLSPKSTRTTVIRNGDLFNSESGKLEPRMSVVVEGDRIVRVGPAASIAAPRGATVIDATGKTILPGMWDMHTHLGFTSEAEGILELAAGVTTARDMASDIDDALSRRARADSGAVLGPREILAGIIDGPGAWQGPTTVLVRTEDEARAWVARYDSLGYKQIKLYNLVHPDLVPTIAAEAHKRGMRLSGHVPRGLSVPAAVLLGFDEIQHAAFLYSTFFEDSLFVPRMRSYGQVAAVVAPGFDLDGAPMKELISFLKQHGTVMDGTFNVWLEQGLRMPDGSNPIFGRTLESLPAPMRREMAVPAASSAEETAAYTANNRAYLGLLKHLYDGGVTLVAGTDNLGGLSYQGELEIYERAGIPASKVLQIATIIPARVMHDDALYGSIAAGKVADLVIVDGRPTERVTDLRKTESVMRAGRFYRSADLYSSIGVAPHH